VEFKGPKNMVMMKSPKSDAGQSPESPSASQPNSPPHASEQAQTKANEGLILRFQDFADENKINKFLVSRTNNGDQIIYPAKDEELSAKFSIERLKQLADHNITRISPSEIVDKTQSNKYSIEHNAKFEGDSPVLTQLHLQQHQQQQQQQMHHPALHPFGIKYSSTPGESELERIKLARTMANGKELSDFGFRIQLGGLSTNYARSDTSEELIVDGNEDSSQDGTSVSWFCYLSVKKDNII
jgi:hypothetical protein